MRLFSSRTGIEIGGSRHQPAAAHQVPELVEDLCEYINANWEDKAATHLAAYVLWRLNLDPSLYRWQWANTPCRVLSSSRQLDLTKTEEMLSMMLARQLYAVHTDATGGEPTEAEAPDELKG